MSGRGWVPGDVALVEAGCWANRKVALRLDEGWAHTNGVNVDGDGIVTPVRPLVVIDPEDPAQVERMARAHHKIARHLPWESLHESTRADLISQVQAALREFANPTPPKPDEPTGLGAVVEDGGATWVRVDLGEIGWCPSAPADGSAAFQCWSDFSSAVRVLSEGVAS